MNTKDLDPGIRDLVVRLNQLGFTTTDSGDGVSKPDMECALPFPHVFMKLSDSVPREAFQDTWCLHYALVDGELGVDLPSEWSVELSYRPADGVCVLALMKETQK